MKKSISDQLIKINPNNLVLSDIDRRKIEYLRKVIKLWKEVRKVLKQDEFRKMIITFDSIEQVGILNPIIIKGNEIIRGRQRIACALELGLDLPTLIEGQSNEHLVNQYKKCI